MMGSRLDPISMAMSLVSSIWLCLWLIAVEKNLPACHVTAA